MVQGGITTTTGLYSDEILNDWFKKAYAFAAGYRKWPFTEGRVSTTFASLVTDEDGLLVGEYPEGWKSDSIRLLKIGGERLDKKDFYKFQNYLEDNSSAEDKIFSDFSRRYYVNPNASVSGTVVMWGQYSPYLDVTDLSALTVFSYNEDEGNEAIVEEMMSYVKKKEDKLAEAEAHHKRAIEILDRIWQRTREEQFAYQEVGGDGMFERFDAVEGGFHDEILKRDQF